MMSCEESVQLWLLAMSSEMFRAVTHNRLKVAAGDDIYNMNTDFNVLHCTDTGTCPVPWLASRHQSGRKLL